KFEVKRKSTGKNETLSAKLAPMPDDVPEKLPLKASYEGALGKKKKEDKKDDPKKDDVKKDDVKKDDVKKDDAKKDDAKKDDAKEEVKFIADDKKDDDEKKEKTGLFKETTAAGDHTYWVFVPDDYDANASYSLVIWLHPVGKGKEGDMKNLKLDWRDFC